MKKFYITTPLYYVNDKPHIGHAYTTILADVLTRYNKLMGKDVFFLTGTDEHGQKVQEAALKLNRTPKKHVDKIHKNYIDLWEKLNINYNKFIRTTDSNHINKVQKVLKNLWDLGEIYTAEYEGLYSVSEERFITEKEYEEGDYREIKRLKEKNYFFKMSKYQKKLINHINENPDFIIPESRKNEILGFLKKPLEDLCISRPKDRLEWGIEMPFDKNYVTYVWFDALLNYITAIEWDNNKDFFNKWWPANYHLMGKDIITTHAVYWTTMLMANKIPLPKHIIAHGWWLIEDAKMSKSIGNVVNPIELINYYGEDSLRFFLMREMTLGHDASFSFDLFKRRYNDDLANDLGNLLNRITILIKKFCNNSIPTIKDKNKIDNDLINKIKNLPIQSLENVKNLKINLAIKDIMSLVKSINKYLEITEPWKALKTNVNNQSSLNTLAISSEAIAISAKLLLPIMPKKCKKILQILGIQNQFTALTFGTLSHNKIQKHAALFPRIDSND
ncbi:MAG: methionine--tRNA ligase [Candidatus Marinimicrobia bacterium]|nr:methionine--tRNA ligase [Candidatus Neomarinimicrobiota bacterium]|tara:strand:- start:23373 stop:24881 length:1509 start_codon:yes stop_codon:yes gene_type:complete